MSRLDILAETAKLARLLHQPEQDLAYLSKLGPERLRALRERANAAIFDEARPTLLRVAAASKLLPVAAIALVGEKVFGPLLCARVGGLLPPERALDVALRLPDPFLADVSVQLDPRSAREVIGRMPAARVAAVAAILLQRQDYVTMGRFVDYLSKDTIRTVLLGIHDNAALLQVAFFVETKARLNDIVSLVPESRLSEIVVRASAPGSQLWAEALALMSHIGPQWQQRIGDMAAAQDEAALTGMLRTAQAQDLWDALLPAISRMSLASRRKLARLPALSEQPVLQAVMQAADRANLWDDLLPLVSEMTEASRRTAAQVFEQLPAQTLQRLFESVQRGNLWADLVGLLGLMQKSERRQIATLLGRQDEAMLRQLLLSTHERNLWPQLLPLLTQMPESQLAALNQLATRSGLQWKV